MSKFETDSKGHQIEKFLNENIEFFREWVMQNVPLSTLELWLAEQQTMVDEMAETMMVDRAVSSAYGAHRASVSSNYVDELARLGGHKRLHRSKERLLKGTQEDMFLELIRDIAEELDVNSLCHKILINVIALINADRGSMFLTRGVQEKKYLVSVLFDVTEHSTLQETLQTEENHISVPFGKGIVGMVAKNKTPINIKDAYEDSRFNKDIDKKTGFRTRSILCMPVLDYEGEVIGVAQVMNKLSTDQTFSVENEKVFSDYLIFAGIGLTNAQMFELSIRESKQSQLLLALAKGISAEQTSLDRLIQRVMFDAHGFIGCVRCAVYLLAADDDTDQPEPKEEATEKVNKEFVKAYEMNASHPEKIVLPRAEVLQHSRAAVLAQMVANSGQTMIIEDTVTNPKYLEEIVDYDGFQIRSLLSIPITNGKGQVIGVMQMMNKTDSQLFTNNDSFAVEKFAVFCGIGVHNCQLYEKVSKLKARDYITTNALAYHCAAPPIEGAKLLARCDTLGSANNFKLYTFDFVYFYFDENELCEAIIRMYLELNILEKLKVPLETGKMFRFFDEFEALAMLIGALGHNMDHRGFTNYSIARKISPLAVLYNSSMLQHHHFDQFLVVLAGERTNIFANLQNDEYKRGLSIVERLILATDFGAFLKKKKVFEDVLAGGEKHWQDAFNKDLLLQVTTTAADVSSVCKPWAYQHRLELLVQSDFFTPDVDVTSGIHKRRIAEIHLGYIDTVCLPAYQMLVKLELALMPLLNNLNLNRNNWKAIAEGTEQKSGSIPGIVKDRRVSQDIKNLSVKKIQEKTKIGKKVDADDDVDLMALDNLPDDTEQELGYEYRCATTFPGVAKSKRSSRKHHF